MAAKKLGVIRMTKKEILRLINAGKDQRWMPRRFIRAMVVGDTDLQPALGMTYSCEFIFLVFLDTSPVCVQNGLVGGR